MKKFISFLIAAASLVAFNSCEEQEQLINQDPSSSFDGTIVFSSAKPEIEEVGVRTVWTGSSVQWKEGDKIRVGFTLDGEWQSSGKEGETAPRFFASSALENDTKIASFSVPFGSNSFQESIQTLTGELVFYGIFPSSACSSATQENAPDVSITIPSRQKPLATSFDSSADLLIGQTETLAEVPTDPVLMNWNRIVALSDITLKNLNVLEGESLMRLTLTAQEGADLVGAHTLNVEDATVSDPEGATNEIVLNISELSISDSNLEVWVGMLPETITSLKVVLETDAAYYTREITGISKTFMKNKRNILGIKMEEAVRTAKEAELWIKKDITSITSSDVFVIVGNNGEDYAMSNSNGTGSAPSATQVSISENSLAANPTDELKWNLEITTNGYIFHPNEDNSKWLYCTNTNNGVRVGTNDAKVFTISDGYLKHVGTSRFVGIYNSQDWRCYTSSSSTNIANQTFAFYVKSTGDEPVLMPVTIEFEDPITTVNVDETVTNVATVDPEGLEITYTSSDEDVATVSAEGVVTGVSVGTATIEASFAGNDEYEEASAIYEITVVDPNANDGSAEKPYTASEAIEIASNLGSETIENVYVKGIVCTPGSVSDGSLNYYVTDDGSFSGTPGTRFEMYKGKYIDGASFTPATNLSVGDFVVANGTLKYYSNGNQAELDAGNTIVSILRAPVFSLISGVYGSAQTLTLSAEEGATIYYTTDGTNPTTSSSIYSTAIPINETMNVKAFAVKGSFTTGIVMGSYTINANANDGSLEKPFTASEARQLALGGNTGSYYISGIVTKIQNQYSASYGTANFWIDENGSSQTVFEAYKIKYFNNVDWVEGNAEIAVNDEVIIYGTLTMYNTTPETSSGYLVSLNGKTKGLTPGTVEVTPDNDNKKITVTWGEATGTTSAISYVISCGTQTYDASAAGSHTFTMAEYGMYTISVVASAADAISANATTTDTLSNGSTPDPVTMNIFSDQATVTGSGQGQTATWTSGDITVTAVRTTSGATAFRNSDTDHTRFYPNWSITVSSANNTIDDVVFTCTTNAYATTFAGSTFTNGVASSSGSIVTVSDVDDSSTATTLSAQVRVSSITVTYK